MAGQDVVTRTGQPHIQLFANTESAPVRWRLLSGNNRELGRGFDEFDDLESCRLGIKHLQSIAADLEPAVLRSDSSTWIWRLHRDGELVAASGHTYDRLIRCRQGLTYFVTKLAAADIGPGLMLTGSRRWQSAGSRLAPSVGTRALRNTVRGALRSATDLGRL
jgi:hypothetical protein